MVERVAAFRAVLTQLGDVFALGNGPAMQRVDQQRERHGMVSATSDAHIGIDSLRTQATHLVIRERAIRNVNAIDDFVARKERNAISAAPLIDARPEFTPSQPCEDAVTELRGPALGTVLMDRGSAVGTHWTGPAPDLGGSLLSCQVIPQRSPPSARRVGIDDGLRVTADPIHAKESPWDNVSLGATPWESARLAFFGDDMVGVARAHFEIERYVLTGR